AAAQRRHDMQQTGIAVQILITQQQLIHGHIGGDRQTACLGIGEHVDGPSAAQATEVRAHAGLFDQQQIPRKGYGFSAFGNPHQTQPRGSGAFVGHATFGQGRVEWGKDDWQVETGGVFQRTAQDAGALHGRQTLSEGHTTGITQRHQLAQVFAIQPASQRADGEYPCLTGAFGAVQNQFSYRGGIQYRAAVRWTAQAGDAANGSSAGFAGDAAFATEARLAQADVQIDQARAGDQAAGINGLRGNEAFRGGAQCTYLTCI